MNIACAVCCELFTPSCEIYCTPCGHIFHKTCLDEWLKRLGIYYLFITYYITNAIIAFQFK